MNDSERIEFLWATAGRIDAYIGTTNAKAGVILAFNTFLVGGLALKAGAFLGPVMASDTWYYIIGTLIALEGIACMASFLITFSVVQPFTKPSQGFHDYLSLIFYGDIARSHDGLTYAEQVRRMDQPNLMEDLARQTHVIAHIATTKFKRLRWATRLAVFFQCPVLLLLLAAQMVTASGGAT